MHGKPTSPSPMINSSSGENKDNLILVEIPSSAAATSARQSGSQRVYKADTVFRAGREKNYKTIGCACMDDSRLSWASTGILIYLLTRPKGWKFFRTEITNREKGGQRAVVSGLKELKAAGYLRVTRSNEPTRGRYTWEWEVSEYPKPEWECRGERGFGPTAGSPGSGFPASGLPSDGATIDGESMDGERTTISKDESSKDSSNEDSSKKKDGIKTLGLEQVEPGVACETGQTEDQGQEDRPAKTREYLRVRSSGYPDAGSSL